MRFKKYSTTCIFILILGHTLAMAAWAAKPGELDPGMVNPGHVDTPPWFKLSFLDIDEDVKEAAKHNKRVVIYFFQDGCPYCKKLLQENFTQKDIVDKTQKRFEFIAMNMWGDREVNFGSDKQMTEKSFAAKLKVNFTPTLLFLNEQGEVVLRLNGYYESHKFLAVLDYVGERQEKTLSLREFFAKQNPQPPTGKLHTQNYFLKKPTDFARILKEKKQPLVVLFEQKVCGTCDDLHKNVMSRPDTRRYFQKLSVAQLDMWSPTPIVTPAGNRTTTAAWAKELNIAYVPSLVFFDVQGAEVMRIEAYFKAFHVQSIADYVQSGAYLKEPNFQRYISERADKLRQQGVEIRLMD